MAQAASVFPLYVNVGRQRTEEQKTPLRVANGEKIAEMSATLAVIRTDQHVVTEKLSRGETTTQEAAILKPLSARWVFTTKRKRSAAILENASFLRSAPGRAKSKKR